MEKVKTRQREVGNKALVPGERQKYLPLLERLASHEGRVSAAQAKVQQQLDALKGRFSKLNTEVTGLGGLNMLELGFFGATTAERRAARQAQLATRRTARVVKREARVVKREAKKEARIQARISKGKLAGKLIEGSPREIGIVRQIEAEHGRMKQQLAHLIALVAKKRATRPQVRRPAPRRLRGLGQDAGGLTLAPVDFPALDMPPGYSDPGMPSPLLAPAPLTPSFDPGPSVLATSFQTPFLPTGSPFMPSFPGTTTGLFPTLPPPRGFERRISRGRPKAVDLYYMLSAQLQAVLSLLIQEITQMQQQILLLVTELQSGGQAPYADPDPYYPAPPPPEYPAYPAPLPPEYPAYPAPEAPSYATGGGLEPSYTGIRPDELFGGGGDSGGIPSGAITRDMPLVQVEADEEGYVMRPPPPREESVAPPALPSQYTEQSEEWLFSPFSIRGGEEENYVPPPPVLGSEEEYTTELAAAQAWPTD
jgi:hypothetical protein